MTQPTHPRRPAMTAFAVAALFSLFPILSLLSSNAGQVEPASAVRSAVVAVAASFVLLAATRLVLRDWAMAALLVAGALLLFFSYGHVYDLVRHAEIAGVLVGRHRFLAPLWAVAGIAWFGLVLRRKVRLPAAWLVMCGAVLVITPSLSLLAWGARAWQVAASYAPAESSLSAQDDVLDLPDIYYIVLDSYGRADVLNDLYGLDNSGFVAGLEQRGFYVASDSRANYSLTLQSLASSLNMRYLDGLAEQMGAAAIDRAPLDQMLQHSEVRRMLEGLGYQTVAFETGYPPTEITDADRYFRPGPDEGRNGASGIPALPINEFEGLLAQTTALRPLLDDLVRRQDLAVQLLSYPYQRHRTRVIFTLDALAAASEPDGPQFVFAHVVSPHTPFVLGQPGEDLVPGGVFSLGDTGETSQGYYVANYTRQVRALNPLVLEALDKILEKTGPQPVIILQSDHGPAATLDLEDPLKGNQRERLGILNAYYVPASLEGQLYPSITPVNTFRVILRGMFGQEMSLLPDESYVAPWERPYAFTNVTEAAQGQ